MHSRIVFVFAVLALTACDTRVSSDAYYNRGGPEQLLDVSSEVVNLSVAGSGELAELSRWVNQDQPTRAELYCSAAAKSCKEARQVLELHGVPVMAVPSGDNSVALVYERILARDCRPTYLNHTHDQYWTTNADYGCAVAGNMVQHVSDKQQFVSPNIMDAPPATGAVGAYQGAYKPQQAASQPYTLDQSTLSQAKSSGGQ